MGANTNRLEQDADDRLHFEGGLADISARLSAVAPDQLDHQMEDLLGQAVELLRYDRCVLAQRVGEKLTTTHSCARPDFQPVPAGMTGEQFPWLERQIESGRVIVLSRIPDDLPVQAEKDRDSLIRLGVKSQVIIPLAVEDAVLGSLIFGSLTRNVDWTERDVRRFRLLGLAFGGAVARKKRFWELRTALEKVQTLKARLEAENLYLRREVVLAHSHDEIIGQSPALRAALAQVEQVAETDTAVLLEGETGTGKELFARAIHDLSRRRDRAMVRVNCATLPSELVESELFGREKGAYTGALTTAVGRFELADGGTIFLDEVGELPLELQAKLLRVLESGEFERLGSPKTIQVNVRVIAATNRNLQEAIQQRKFREDLFYRLNVFPIALPPLRERREDITLLIRAFVEDFNETMGKSVETISKGDLTRLEAYGWPGNVRELRNLVERAMIIAGDEKLTIPLPLSTPGAAAPTSLALRDVEREHILQVLELTRWRVRGKHGASELLQMKPSTLEYRMKKLGIQRPD